VVPVVVRIVAIYSQPRAGSIDKEEEGVRFGQSRVSERARTPVPSHSHRTLHLPSTH
jgi:hypothetical protein